MKKPAQSNAVPATIFISYSHDDRKWKDRLVSQLIAAGLEQEGIWADTQIEAGDDWEDAIEAAMRSASVGVLMLSGSSLKSEFIRKKEVATLIARKQREGLRVVPILVGPCPWKRVDWLKVMQIRPPGAIALGSMTKKKADLGLVELALEIAGFVERATQRPVRPASSTKRRGPGAAPLRRRTPRARGTHGGIQEHLYTLCGLRTVDDARDKPETAMGLTSILRLWADPTHDGNLIQAFVVRERHDSFCRVRFRNEPGCFPSNVTIRPRGVYPLPNPKRRRFLALDARGVEAKHPPNSPLKLGLSFRVIDRRATHWTKGLVDTASFEVPLDRRWHSIFIDLTKEWMLFSSDGNYLYAAEQIDPSVLAAVVVELGSIGGPRLGSGEGTVDLRNIRLCDKKR